MTTPDPSEPLLAADLSIEVAEHEGKTMTVHRIKQDGKLMFRNKDARQPLTITSAAAEPPFVLEGCTSPASSFVVAPDDKVTVTIAPAYIVGSRFSYQAQIKGATAEDPIVIVDRR